MRFKAVFYLQSRGIRFEVKQISSVTNVINTMYNESNNQKFSKCQLTKFKLFFFFLIHQFIINWLLFSTIWKIKKIFYINSTTILCILRYNNNNNTEHEKNCFWKFFFSTTHYSWSWLANPFSWLYYYSEKWKKIEETIFLLFSFSYIIIIIYDFSILIVFQNMNSKFFFF